MFRTEVAWSVMRLHGFGFCSVQNPPRPKLQETMTDTVTLIFSNLCRKGQTPEVSVVQPGGVPAGDAKRAASRSLTTNCELPLKARAS